MITLSKAQPSHFVIRNGRAVKLPTEVEHESKECLDEIEQHAAAPIVMSAKRKIVLAAFAISLFLPNAYSLGRLNLTPEMFVLLACIFPLMVRFFRKQSGDQIISDWLVIGFVLWAAITRLVLFGVLASIEQVGLLTMQTLGAYMIGRVLVRSETEMRFAYLAISGIFAVISLFLVYESFTGHKVLLQLTRMLGPTAAPVQNDPRFGFNRAQGVFEHPILLGMFAAGLLSITAYTLKESRNAIVRLCVPAALIVSAMTTLSSGALVSLNVQFGLMLWQRVMKAIKSRWRILIGLVVCAYVAVDIGSNRTPMAVFADYASFNQQSSYNRVLIWRYGTAAVAKHPIIGHGYETWDRPAFMHDSMDNFWLVLAFRYGLVGMLLLLGAFVATIAMLGRVSGPTEYRDGLRRGAIFSLVATMVGIFTVHLWNNAYVFLMFMLGSVAWLGQSGSAKSRAAAQVPEANGTSRS